jgi:hypothetical protein
MHMKSSMIRGVIIFAAGAGCATVVAQVVDEPRPPITLERWQKLATDLLPHVAELGYYTERTSDGTVGIRLDPIACGPRPPVPKLPAGAVDSRELHRGLAALRELETGYLMEDPNPVYAVIRCQERR